jgi:hypothetical protein
MGFKSKNNLPRHVEARCLADGTIAYYWRAPPRFRPLAKGFPTCVPLGSNLASAERTAAALNEDFDCWRRGQRGQKHTREAEIRGLLGIEKNGFLSSTKRAERW